MMTVIITFMNEIHGDKGMTSRMDDPFSLPVILAVHTFIDGECQSQEGGGSDFTRCKE
jgi:hypothetical protein